MPAQFRNPGRTVKYTPVADVTAGQMIKVSNFLGVADNPIAAGKQGDLTIVGIYEIPASSALITDIATAGGRPIGHPIDLHVANQNLVVDGTGDANILLYLAEAVPVPTGLLRVFINRFGC